MVGSRQVTSPSSTRTVTTVVDRKDLIIRGGYNVYPRNRRSAARASAVAQVAVIGIPTTPWEVGAAVVLKADATVGG